MEKYLRHYAEPEIRALESLPDRYQWENVLVIPACNETPGFLRPPPACGGRSLMILVINEPVSASDEVSASNRALAKTVKKQFSPRWDSVTDSGIGLFRDPHAQRDVLLVDRFSEGRQLPAKQGVGLARKIGADLATGLIFNRQVTSNWIHCSDGDVCLPAGYFTYSNTQQCSAPELAALIYPFHHCDDSKKAESEEVMLATQLYELSLRYYVAGMKFARSPYAFHTIGSTMAVQASHYAKVRGFPKREAGEDFYILNKLAKTGTVRELGVGEDCQALEIEARRSERVPFGTGAAVNKITALADPVSEFRFYHPMVFELLQHWLQTLPAMWRTQSSDLAEHLLPGPGDEDSTRYRHALLAGLQKIGTRQALDHSFRQSKTLDQFTRQMHTWFDAFRTLKLIHVLRDLHLASVSYSRLERNHIFNELLRLDPGRTQEQAWEADPLSSDTFPGALICSFKFLC
jgi:hypothetical protein